MGENNGEYFIQSDQKRLDTPFHQATQGNNGLEINKLLSSTGNVTLDYGFGNTANCESKTVSYTHLTLPTSDLV